VKKTTIYVQRMLARALLLLASGLAGALIAGLPIGIVSVWVKFDPFSFWSYLTAGIGGVWHMCHCLESIVAHTRTDGEPRSARRWYFL
jgi:hypothetical protein